jgi:SAM-dependent methyltransferase
MLEHLEYPERAMSEMARVLKTHGVLYLKTPNLWNYTMLLSWATSTGVHNFFRSLTGADDNIPTFYRANTEGKLTRLANANGFAVRRLELVSYSYMYYAFNKELFVTMRSLSKVVGKVTSRMRQTILCVFEKVHDAPDAMSRGGDVR